jgi:hypothetical protein
VPTKRRTPKLRDHRVTEAAVAAFLAGDRLALHRALGLKPWQPSPIDATEAEPPAWAGPMDGWRAGWQLARALREKLEAAHQPD